MGDSILSKELDKIDWKKCRKEGEKLDRQIGIRSLTVEDWFQPFTIYSFRFSL